MFEAPAPEEVCGGGVGQVGAILKLGICAEFVAQGDVPDLPGFFPGVAAEFHGGDVEGAVGDARIDVDAAVVAGGVDVVVHVTGLRVLAEDWVVVGGARFFHGPDADSIDIGREQPLADDPVRLGGGVVEGALFDERAEHVGHGFVQCAGLVGVDEFGFELGDAVGQFVTNDVNGDGEAVEEAVVLGLVLVTVAVDHLVAVPEGVVVALPVMDGGFQLHAVPVDRVSVVNILVQVVGCAASVVGFVDRDIG